MSITLKNQSALSQDQEADLLISALHVWGIDYLIASSQNAAMKRAASRLAPVELIKRLARCELPRVRDASISLFLLHPELADAAHEAYKTSEPSESEQIAILILATLYLQRLWSFRLRFAFRRVPHFTEERFAHLWQERALPAPHCQYGRAGLEALQAREQQRRGLPVNFIEDWQNQIEHLLKQEESKHHSAAKFTGLAVLQGEEEQIEFASPADFIPIPSRWTAHAKFIGRYGKIDAFYFDLYSLALSKISRSSDRDLVDVKLLVQQKLITLDELDAAYQEVLPRMGKRPYINLDPQKFAERYRIVRQQL